MKQRIISPIKLQLLMLLSVLLLSGSANGQFEESKSGTELVSNYFLDSPDSTKYAVILVGPTIGEVNQTQFRQWSFSLHDILSRDYG